MTQSPANTEDYITSSSSWGGGIFEILFILIVFVCILFLAYIVTRFVANKAAGRLKSRHIEVVDTLNVGGDSQFLIVKAGREYFLASKSQKQLSLFTKLDMTPEEMAETAAAPASFAESFRSALEGQLGLAPKKRRPVGPAGAEPVGRGIPDAPNRGHEPVGARFIAPNHSPAPPNDRNNNTEPVGRGIPDAPNRGHEPVGARFIAPNHSPAPPNDRNNNTGPVGRDAPGAPHNGIPDAPHNGFRENIDRLRVLSNSLDNGNTDPPHINEQDI